MTEPAVSAPGDATLGDVAELMRDRNVGSVVILEHDRPVALITDRDMALALGAEAAARDEPVSQGFRHPWGGRSELTCDCQAFWGTLGAKVI